MSTAAWPGRDVGLRLRWQAVLGLLVLGAALGAQARSLADIQRTRELRVCIAPIHPAYASVHPENCRDHCSFSGPNHEEALAFAASLGPGIQPRFIRVDWDEQFFNHEGKTVREASYTPRLLASGKCDLYPSNLTRNAWRANKVDIVTLFPSRMMVITHRRLQAQLREVADLAGRSVAIEKDTSWHTWLQAQNQTAFAARPMKLELMSTQDSFAAVDAGRVDFTLSDSDMAIWSARHQFKNAAVAFPVGPTDEIGWAFRKEDQDLQQAVQKFFDAQRRQPNSELNRIWKAHFGRSLTEFIALMAAVK